MIKLCIFVSALALVNMVFNTIRVSLSVCVRAMLFHTLYIHTFSLSLCCCPFSPRAYRVMCTLHLVQNWDVHPFQLHFFNERWFIDFDLRRSKCRRIHFFFCRHQIHSSSQTMLVVDVIQWQTKQRQFAFYIPIDTQTHLRYVSIKPYLEKFVSK